MEVYYALLRDGGPRQKAREGARGFHRCGRVRNSDPTLGSIAGRGSLRDRSRSVARVPPFPIQKVGEGRGESRGTADAFQDIGRPRLPELAEWFDVDPGIGEGPEGRHEGERHSKDEEQDPGRSKGAGPPGQLALRTLG